MKKFLLSAIGVAAMFSAYAQDAIEWGEWQEMATSTVVFPDQEFIYTGTISDVPTFYREALNEEGRAQYRFDDVFSSNITDEKGSLVVDIYTEDYGTVCGVSPQTLPPFDLNGVADPDYVEWFKGPYSVCDMAAAFDMPFYRTENKYTAQPMSMKPLLVLYDSNYGPMEGLFGQGVVEIKTNAKPAFSLPSSYVIGGDMGMGLIKVDKEDSVWTIKYALEKGDANKIDFETYDYVSLTDRIMNDDESLNIMYYMAGDLLASPMEGPGKYALGAVAYDENDNVLGTAVCDVYNMPTESWNWQLLGKAKVTEDFLRDVFGMNIYDAGIEANGPAEYEVEVEESKATPGLYRLINMYGPSHPYSAIFEYLNEFPVYTYIDCTSEAGCYIYNMPTGFVVKNDTSGEILFGSQISVFENAGWPLEQLPEVVPEYFGTKNDNVITFKSNQVALYVPVFTEYFGEGWIEGDFCTENDFIIELPEGTGVESASVAEKAEYYDLNGIRVDNPTKGGIYIMRKGSKVEKVVK